MLKALDPEAPGPVPYSLAIEPGGKVLYRFDGRLDPADLQSKLGAYYTP
jgi:hypothetical protein